MITNDIYSFRKKMMFVHTDSCEPENTYKSIL